MHTDVPELPIPIGRRDFMTPRSIAVLTAGFLTVSVAYAVRYGYGMLLPEMLAAWKITKTKAGVIYSAYFLAYTICSPVLGALSDRYDVRLILTFFTGLLAAGAFLMGYADSVWSAALFFTMAGIGHSACWAPVVSLVQRWVNDRRRGAALSFTTMGSGAGIAVWSLTLPLIVGYYDWKAGWISMGIFGFAVAGMNFLLVRSEPESKKVRPDGVCSNPAHAGPAAPSYGDLLRSGTLWRIGLAYFCVGFTVLVPYTFLGVYATESLGMAYGVSTRFIAVIAIVGMIGKLVIGILSDTLGRIRMMMICGLLMGGGCLGMAVLDNRGAIYGAAGLFGFGFGAVWPVYAAAAPDFFPKKSSGAVIGLWTLFLGVGSIVSPILCGWTIDQTGRYSWAFILGLISGMASAILLIGLRPRGGAISL